MGKKTNKYNVYSKVENIVNYYLNTKNVTFHIYFDKIMAAQTMREQSSDVYLEQSLSSQSSLNEGSEPRS